MIFDTPEKLHASDKASELINEHIGQDNALHMALVETLGQNSSVPEVRVVVSPPCFTWHLHAG
eukprot:4491421-Pyramimonas_sp.AAC.1